MKYKAYSKEFKLDALNLVKTNGFVATARDLGVSETSLRNWADKYNFSKQSDETEMQDVAALMERYRALEKENKKLKATVEILKEATTFLSGRTEMKFRKINRHYKEKPSVELLCEVLRVSRSGYYKWKKRDRQPV